MLEIYKISVDGQPMILFSEDYIKHCVFVARLTEYFSGNVIHVDKVRYWKNTDLSIDLHIFLHDLYIDDADYADYALAQEKIRAFGTPFFQSFLDTLYDEDDELNFIDYFDRDYTTQFLCVVEANKDHLMKEAD